jgi:2-polyprenyl-6-methoxyphenol hydroxylase-like FAD-dependent oxidoreductase
LVRQRIKSGNKHLFQRAVTPIEGGLWIATLYGRGQDTAPPDLSGFRDWAAGLPHPIIHQRLCEAEPASAFHTYNLPTGRWFRYDRMPRFPEGVLPLGEAVTAFNPMYGQGIALAAAQVMALEAGLTARAANGGNLQGLAADYFDNSTPRNQIGWSAMETAGLMFATTKGDRPADIEARWRFARALHDQLPDNPALQRQALRVTHLLDPPSSLQSFKIDG